MWNITLLRKYIKKEDGFKLKYARIFYNTGFNILSKGKTWSSLGRPK